MRLLWCMTWAQGVPTGLVETFLELLCYLRLFLPNPPSSSSFTSVTWSEDSLAYSFFLPCCCAFLHPKPLVTLIPSWHLLGGFEPTFWRNGKHGISLPKAYLSHTTFTESESYLHLCKLGIDLAELLSILGDIFHICNIDSLPPSLAIVANLDFLPFSYPVPLPQLTLMS